MFSKSNATVDLTKAVELIKEFEGLRLKAYYDPIGILTIGYGSVCKEVTPGTIWTKEQAESALYSRVHEDALKIMTLVPGINNQQLCAICSFTYNLGMGRFRSSTLRRKIKEYIEDSYELDEHREEIKKQFMRWTKAGGRVLPGLVRRRAAEVLLFFSNSI